jgi:hypothetical protein
MKHKAVLMIFVLGSVCVHAQTTSLVDVAAIDRERILRGAEAVFKEEPITITAYRCERSAGGPNDFFSEGDYWWPNPKDSTAPYIQRDGMTNPDNFVLHRQAMLNFNRAVSTLTAAYKITSDKKYAQRAVMHLRAWFITPSTKMNPHLKYAQAIRNKVTGRGIGIIDTIHLMEVARSVEVLINSKALSPEDAETIKNWFKEYLEWLTTHQYGIDEREAKNNHGTWWVAQVAEFAHLVGDTAQLAYCRNRFKKVLISNQMATDGSFPLELKRTKPYNYSLFNLEGFASICQIASTPNDNLWNFAMADGRSMKKAIEFLYPYILDKSHWPYPKDVMYYEFYPTRQPSLLFAGVAYNDQRFIDQWKSLDGDPTNPEVIRSLAIKQPILWINE